MLYTLSSLKPRQRGSERKKSSISLALLHASPLRVEPLRSPVEHGNVGNNLSDISVCAKTVDCKQKIPSKQENFIDGRASSTIHELEAGNEDLLSSNPPFHPHYPEEKVFKAALELFNKQNEECYQRSATPSVLRKWVCKGDVRVSFQLCVLCKDMGKFKDSKETYYLDVLEVTMYRTILCKKCLGYILHEHVGSCLTEIEE